jgi:predicted transcriptional regulator
MTLLNTQKQHSCLDTKNPDQIIYANHYLEMTVLGGVRLDGLDRMRVTIKVALPQSERPPLRHNLDLYNDSQCEKFIRKIAERLEIGTSLVAGCLSELTEQLENYRLEQLKAQSANNQKAAKPLTAEEVRAARAFLEEKNLLQRTNELIGTSGIVGEEKNRLLLYLIFTSRKLQRPLHAISLATSGTGKTHLQEKVGELIPEEDRIEITTLSENAFYYFGQRELKHRVILIEDLDGAENVLYPLRELQSKRKITKTIAHKNTKGETKTITLTVEGPVSVSGCTTQESVYEDNANRSFLLYLDESAEQDAKIMQYQRAQSAGVIDTLSETKAQELLKNVQRVLQPITIKNPYAEKLVLPAEILKPRRTNAHYLQFIEAVTFYHQAQRTQHVDQSSGEVYIQTTPEDIAAANELIKDILLRKSDELSGACRNYFEKLKAWLQQHNKHVFTNGEIRNALRTNSSNQKRYMLELKQCGLIKIAKGDKKNGFYYEVVSVEEYTQLQSAIDGVLQNVLQAVQGSEEVLLSSEPLKTQSANRKGKKFTETAERQAQ